MKIFTLVTLIMALTACSDGAIIGANKSFSNGKYAEAITKALHAESKHNYSPIQQAELYFIVAESYAKLNETAKAMAMYKYIVENYPETKFSLLSEAVLENSPKLK